MTEIAFKLTALCRLQFLDAVISYVWTKICCHMFTTLIYFANTEMLKTPERHTLDGVRNRTSTHPSRIRTARFRMEVYGIGGGSIGGLSYRGRVWYRGAWYREVYTPRCLRGIHPLPSCILGYTTPTQLNAGIHALWTEWMTHACENITFPQLHLWAVKMR